MLSIFYINDDEAIEAGLHYSATLYGFKIYTDNNYQNPSIACAFQPAIWIITAISSIIELGLMLCNSDVLYELPIENVVRISKNKGD